MFVCAAVLECLRVVRGKKSHNPANVEQKEVGWIPHRCCHGQESQSVGQRVGRGIQVLLSCFGLIQTS